MSGWIERANDRMKGTTLDYKQARKMNYILRVITIPEDGGCSRLLPLANSIITEPCCSLYGQTLWIYHEGCTMQ